jgi:hypothetical protein
MKISKAINAASQPPKAAVMEAHTTPIPVQIISFKKFTPFRR